MAGFEATVGGAEVSLEKRYEGEREEDEAEREARRGLWPVRAVEAGRKRAQVQCRRVVRLFKDAVLPVTGEAHLREQ